MSRLNEYLAGRLSERSSTGNLRTLSSSEATVVDFCSNDYLGMVTTGLLGRLMQQGSAAAGRPGSTGSRLISGNSPETEALEIGIARFHKAEAALLYNSGYDANVGLLSCIASRHTIVLYDELCHASIKDGIRLSQCRGRYTFDHNNMADLQDKLTRLGSGGPVIVVAESVYSMDGDRAPLSDLAEICCYHGASLIIDEAHATGVYGHGGEGLVCAGGLEQKVFARVHTFGKALGCHGAVVAGSALLQQYLVNFSRSLIYTTALPAHSVHAISCAYRYLRSPDFSNEALHELVRYFRHKINVSTTGRWLDSDSPIQALIVADNERCRQTADILREAGLRVHPILYPTVPAGAERLRICLHTFNTPQQIDLLFSVLEESSTARNYSR